MIQPLITTDDFLIQRFLEGDSHAFNQIVQRYKRMIFQFILNKVGDSELAADLTQDVFVRLFRSAHQYEKRGKFKSWFFRMAQNICIDAHRKQPKALIVSLDQPQQDDPGSPEFFTAIKSEIPGPDVEIEIRETRQLIEQALSLLSENQRTAFILCQFQGMHYQEIAAIQKCPVGTVKSRVHIALTHIRDYLKNNGLL